MRTALRVNAPRGQVSRGYSMPAPVDGWDAVSPLARMDPRRAVVLDNWFPQPGYVELRKGHVRHVDTGVAAAAESLMAYHGLTANKMFAAVASKIYDVTIAGTATEAVTGLASARWQHINFATTGGDFLWIANGSDDPRYFNGTSWFTAALTGISAKDVIAPAAFKGRIWLTLDGQLDAFYLPVDSIQGAVSRFVLGALFTRGGYLMAIGTWSLDGGDGPDDYIAFLTSRGQVAIYSGSNPGGGGDFVLRGVYDIAAPIGRRCLLKMAGDLAVITVEGVLPLSKALITGKGAAENIALTKRIQPVMAQSARD